MAEYLFDTNIFIVSKNELPADVWPTFWLRLSELIKAEKICSSIKVKEEIERGKDELTIWMKNNTTRNFYCPINEAVLEKYTEAQRWAIANHNYSEAARNQFAEVADAYLIATAAAYDMTLVTNEKSAPGSKKSIKIPDVCNALSIKYCDLNTVLRDLGVQI